MSSIQITLAFRLGLALELVIFLSTTSVKSLKTLLITDKYLHLCSACLVAIFHLAFYSLIDIHELT